MEHTVRSSIFITYQLVGFHRWPNAPVEVDYLRDRHRHLFKVRIDVSVENAERQIEYHLFKRAFEAAVFNWAAGRGFQASPLGLIDHTSEINFGSQSCEAIAEIFLDFVMDLYPGHEYYRVEVSEDGENGSVVEARA